jgi:hypothetical protein
VTKEEMAKLIEQSADMATYRQALRDITAHEDFPDLEKDDWPTAP